jgi:hypothetical protein
MSLSLRLSVAPRIRPVRWGLLLPLTAGLALTGMPANAVSPSADAIITGTVSFHETNPDRTVEVFRQVGDTWSEDEARQTVAAPDGSYEVHVPAGEPVKLRVSYGSYEYGYWYGDGFGEITAVPVEAPGGTTMPGIDLDVPAPAWVTGRVTNRAGMPMEAIVAPSVNNDGGLRPITDAPIATSPSGAYTVILPADHETGLMGVSHDGNVWAWLGGGGISEPNFYINLVPGERRQVEDLVLPIGQPSSSANPAPAAATRLTATGAPAVHGAARKGAVLRATTGRWNLAPTKVRYQWLRNGVVIRGATRPSYKLIRADVRKRVSVRVTASRAGVRAAASALSARTARVKKR